MDITPEMAAAELQRRRAAQSQDQGQITPEMARAELARRRLPQSRIDSAFDAVSEAPETTMAPQYVADDVIKSGGSGLARGVMDVIGLPGTIADGMSDGLQYGLSKGYEAVTGREPQFEAGGFERFFSKMPDELRKELPYGGRTMMSSGVLNDSMAKLSGGATAYQPKTVPGEYARTIGEFAPAALTSGGGLGGVVKYGVLPALASETAGQATKGTPIEPYARAGAAIGTGVGAGMLSKSKALKNATSTEQIRQQGGDLYDAAKLDKITLTQGGYGRIVNDLNKAAADFGIARRDAPGVLGALKDMTKELGSTPTLKQVEAFRKSINNAARSNATNASQKELARVLIEKLDNSLAGITARDVLAGSGGLRETLATLKEARKVWRAKIKASIIDDAFEKASVAASGDENGLRNAFRAILKSKTQKNAFSAEEITMMKKAVRGGPIDNALRFAGKFGVPVDGGNNALGAVMGGVGGFAAAGPLGSAAALIASTAAKKGSQIMTQRNMELVEAVIKSGGSESGLIQAINNAKSGARLEASLRSMLQGNTSARSSDPANP
jgi:hypothetical protein